MKSARALRLQPPVGIANSNAALVTVTVSAVDPKRVNRIAEILLDIIDTAKRVDSKINPEQGGRP